MVPANETHPFNNEELNAFRPDNNVIGNLIIDPTAPAPPLQPIPPIVVPLLPPLLPAPFTLAPPLPGPTPQPLRVSLLSLTSLLSYLPKPTQLCQMLWAAPSNWIPNTYILSALSVPQYLCLKSTLQSNMPSPMPSQPHSSLPLPWWCLLQTLASTGL